MENDHYAPPETFELTKYWDFLSSLPSELKEIMLRHDDEMASGRVGARSNWDGEIVFDVYAISTDHADFVKKMTELQMTKDVDFYWNLMTAVTNKAKQDFAMEVIKSYDLVKKE